MPFYNADPFITAMRNYRLVYIDGRYGGGKTALAFRLAYELVIRWKYRYIMSNTLSVWNDDPKKVYLQNNNGGMEVNGVLVLDESGEFMESRSAVKEWLSFNRKIDTIMLLPSFLPPSRDVRILTVQRIFNANIIGIPAWFFRWEIDKGSVRDGGVFAWWKPFEIFGIYDTRGMPTDANILLDMVKAWVAKAAAALSYQETAQKTEGTRTVAIDFTSFSRGLSEGASSGAPANENSSGISVDDLQGAIDDFAAITKRAEAAVSVSRKGKGRGRR